MNQSIKNKVAQTFAALVVTAALSGCQTGKTPHPFTTMFDHRAPVHGVTQASYRADIPETMGEQGTQTAAAAPADVQ